MQIILNLKLNSNKIINLRIIRISITECKKYGVSLCNIIAKFRDDAIPLILIKPAILALLIRVIIEILQHRL